MLQDIPISFDYYYVVLLDIINDYIRVIDSIRSKQVLAGFYLYDIISCCPTLYIPWARTTVWSRYNAFLYKAAYL